MKKKYFRMLSEKERLERVCEKLPAGKTNKDFSIFNENQQAVFYNKFGLEDFKYGVNTLNEEYTKRLLKEQEKNPQNYLCGSLGCASSRFDNALEDFSKVRPEFRPKNLKTEIIPYILEFERKYVTKPEEYIMELLSILEYETPNEVNEPFLRDYKYFESLPRERKNAFKKADKIALEKIYSGKSYLSEKRTFDFNKMSELYEFAGEKELAQFCGTWPLGDRIKGAGDLAEKLIDNLFNKGQLVPGKQKEIKIPKELYPSINDKQKISN